MRPAVSIMPEKGLGMNDISRLACENLRGEVVSLEKGLNFSKKVNNFYISRKVVNNYCVIKNRLII